MAAQNTPQNETRLLEMSLNSSGLPVSYLSSLLRVTQAAVRAVALNSESTSQAFAGQPQPILLASAHTSEDGHLILSFVFADPINSKPLTELSVRAFKPFINQFVNLLKGLPQPGLWEASSRRTGRRRYASDIEKRMDQLRLELRRFSRAQISFDNRTIRFEGDRMEID